MKENYVPTEFENVGEMANFLKKKKATYLKLTQEEIENFISP